MAFAPQQWLCCEEFEDEEEGFFESEDGAFDSVKESHQHGPGPGVDEAQA